uniref:Uncharacterized protein n=1 Tax=Ditylenchus dipsaci TaxID=166011 RepID=A0A915E4C0_9BILA
MVIVSMGLFLETGDRLNFLFKSVALIVYRDYKEQARVRKELMDFLYSNCDSKWTRWICPRDEVDDYIKLHRTTPDEDFCERKHWGNSSLLILAARLYTLSASGINKIHPFFC